MEKEIVIKIPFKTISVNSQWFIWRNRKILTKHARKMKIDISNISKKYKGYFDKTDKLFISIDVHESWYTKKNGSFRKKDLLNKQKLLIDALFDGLGLDDSQIFETTLRKIHSVEEYSLIKLKKIQQQSL